jgi:hypothetical protein
MNSVKIRDILPLNLIQTAEMLDKMSGSYLRQIGALSLAPTDVYRVLGISNEFLNSLKNVNTIKLKDVFPQELLSKMASYTDFLKSSGLVFSKYKDPYDDIFVKFQKSLKELDPNIKKDLMYTAEQSFIFEKNLTEEEPLSRVLDEFESISSPDGIKEFCHNHPIIMILIAWFVNFMLNNIAQPVWDHYEEIFMSRGDERIISKAAVKEEFRRFDIRDDLVEKFRYVKAATLNVRESHGMRSRVIGKLHFEDSVEVLFKREKWVKIRYKNSHGDFIEGWVYSKYVAKFK